MLKKAEIATWILKEFPSIPRKCSPTNNLDTAHTFAAPETSWSTPPASWCPHKTQPGLLAPLYDLPLVQIKALSLIKRNVAVTSSSPEREF